MAEQQREMKFNPDRSVLDQLIAVHAAELREVYEKRTAGDMTFTGMLVEFVWDLRDSELLTVEGSER